MNQNRWPHAASALAISYSDKKQGNAAATLSRNHGVIRHRWRITPYLVRATSTREYRYVHVRVLSSYRYYSIVPYGRYYYSSEY